MRRKQRTTEREICRGQKDLLYHQLSQDGPADDSGVEGYAS